MATKLGIPAIPNVRSVDVRSVAEAMAAARQRIEALEKQVALVTSQAGQTAYAGGGGSGSNASTAGLSQRIAALESVVSALLGLDDGLVVLKSGSLITRVLIEGANVDIENSDGADGNPIISVPFPVLRDPATGALALAGAAPTTSIALAPIAPAAGVLAVAGMVPSVTTPTVVAPPTEVLVFAGAAPLVGTSSTAAPGVGAAAIDTAAPTVAVSGGSEAHQYWRVTGISVPGGTYLEISELQFMTAGVRQVGTMDSSESPLFGSVSDLNDNNLFNRCYWLRAVAEGSGFFVRVAFATAKAIDGVAQGGFDTSDRYMAGFTLEYSDDNSSWTPLGSKSGLSYPGNNTLSSVYSFP